MDRLPLTTYTPHTWQLRRFSGLPELLTSNEWDTIRLRFIPRAVIFLIHFLTFQNSIASKRVMKSLEKTIAEEVNEYARRN